MGLFTNNIYFFIFFTRKMIYNIIDIENTKQNIRLRNKMVKDYLEKIRQEYIEHKVSLEEQISSYENKVKENTKFLQVLEKETNPGYEAFSPSRCVRDLSA